MGSFDEAVEYVLTNEGGLNVNPHDQGGVTNYGISSRLIKLSSHKYQFIDYDNVEKSIKELTKENAKIVYKTEFWDAAPFDQISNQEICNYIFDSCINMGMHAGVLIAQTSCFCVLKEYKKSKEDGKMGKNTIDDIKKCGYLLMPALRATRAAKYRSLAEKEVYRENLEGWLKRAYEH